MPKKQPTRKAKSAAQRQAEIRGLDEVRPEAFYPVHVLKRRLGLKRSAWAKLLAAGLENHIVKVGEYPGSFGRHALDALRTVQEDDNAA